MEPLTEKDLEPDELGKLHDFLVAYPGDSKNEQRRLKKAWLDGFQKGAIKMGRNVVSALRDGLSEIEDLTTAYEKG